MAVNQFLNLHQLNRRREHFAVSLTKQKFNLIITKLLFDQSEVMIYREAFVAQQL